MKYSVIILCLLTQVALSCAPTNDPSSSPRLADGSQPATEVLVIGTFHGFHYGMTNYHPDTLRSLGAVRESEHVRLDRDGKIQCMTCHDPHSDRYYVEGRVPRFWVGPTVEEVCLTCHELR